MPVLYKPKFCCNCGEKVDRVSWSLTTSRRFCDVCAVEQKQHDLIPRVLAGICVFVGLFGVSGYMARSGSNVGSAVPPKLTSSKVLTGAEPLGKLSGNVANQGVAGNASKAESGTIAVVSPKGIAKQNTEQNAVYFCGAITKKGTACSRRVKQPGRCWQHQGQAGEVAGIATTRTR